MDLSINTSYLGTCYVSKFNRWNRIDFPLEFKESFYRRTETSGDRDLSCVLEGDGNYDFITLFDPLTNKKGLSTNFDDIKNAGIVNKKKTKLRFPRGIRLNGECLAFLGCGDHFEIWAKEDWEEIQKSLKS